MSLKENLDKRVGNHSKRVTEEKEKSDQEISGLPDLIYSMIEETFLNADDEELECEYTVWVTSEWYKRKERLLLRYEHSGKLISTKIAEELGSIITYDIMKKVMEKVEKQGIKTEYCPLNIYDVTSWKFTYVPPTSNE